MPPANCMTYISLPDTALPFRLVPSYSFVVPASLLITSTPDDVDAYCKKLIQKVGKGGGLILGGATGIPDEAKVENVIAMAESVKKYAN